MWLCARVSCLGVDEQEEDVISEADRIALKHQAVPFMIALAPYPALQVQIGEAISLMAETDFPMEWADLIDVRPACSKAQCIAHFVMSSNW